MKCREEFEKRPPQEQARYIRLLRIFEPLKVHLHFALPELLSAGLSANFSTGNCTSALESTCI
jgi:hypothetical protein